MNVVKLIFSIVMLTLSNTLFVASLQVFFLPSILSIPFMHGFLPSLCRSLAIKPLESKKGGTN